MGIEHRLSTNYSRIGYIYIHVYTYVCVYVCMYVCIYIYIYIYMLYVSLTEENILKVPELTVPILKILKELQIKTFHLVRYLGHMY
jgi:hypothetical protein